MRACDSGLWLLLSLGLLHGIFTCFAQGVTSFGDLLSLSSATGDVVVELASGNFTWSQHLEVPDAVTSLVIRGSRQRDANGQPSTRFVCDDSALPAAEALFTYQGLSLTIENVTFTGCQNRAVSMVFIANADARVSIVGSLFHNNSRTVDTANPDNDKPLCLYVGDNFVGSLDLTSTSFIANTWAKPVPAGRRREAQEVGGIDAPPPAAPPADDGAGSSSGEGGGFGTTAGGYGSSYGGGHNDGYGGYGGDGGYGGYGGGDSNGSSPPPAEPEGDGGTPGDAAGDNKLRAWQTTVGVACGGGPVTNCSVTVTNSEFINNTGGLNSALYVLCKATTIVKTVNVYQTDTTTTEEMLCNVNVVNTMFTGNTLLDVDTNGKVIVELGGPQSAVLLAAVEAYNLYFLDPEFGFGLGGHAGNVDIPVWINTTTGTLVPDWNDLAVENVLAKAPPPIQIHAAFTGCHFNGTNTGGAGIAVTAYAAGTSRPPEDMYSSWNGQIGDTTATAPNSFVNITSCLFSGHTSGFPAAHILAPRSLMISESIFTNNTGALAAVAAENTTIISTLIVDNVAYSSALDMYTHPPNDTASTVKIQPNYYLRNVSVVLDRVTHSGNGGRQTGSFAVLYLSALFDLFQTSSSFLNVSVNIRNSTFTNNSCESKDCVASERALHILGTRYVQMNDTTFENNSMGALALEDVGEFFASRLAFRNNSNPMIYTPGGQFSMGAAGLYAGTDIARSMNPDWHRPGFYLVEDSNFSDNWAAGPGAAVVVKGISSQYRRCVFAGNQAANGGAMYIESNDLYIHNCTFFNNTAAYSGGAINFNGFSDPYGNSGQALRILHTAFNNNTAAWYTPKFDTVTNTEAFYLLFGGGAMHVVNNQASLQISGCNFTGNTAMGNKGGALQLLTPKLGEVVTCRFEANEAAAGGAIYVEKAPDTFVVARSEFISNSVLRQVDDSERFALAIAGQGGAIYGLASLIDIRCTSRFEDNLAMQGGAVYASAQSSLYINGYSNVLSCPLQMYKDRAYLAGFINNGAVLGGAIYTDGSSMSISSTPGERNRTWLYDGKQDLRDEVDSNEVMPLGVLFYGNRACGGGAIYSYSAWSLNMVGVALVANEARLSVELDNQLRQGLFAAFPASGGVGGGVAFIGQAASRVAIQQVDFINNSAIDGGAISLAGETLCRKVEGCYNFTLYQVTMAGNRALNGSGGAVHWLQKDILQIRSCDLDPKYPPVQVTEYIPDLLLRNATDVVQDGAVRIDTFSSDYDQFNATYLKTYRYITFSSSVQYNFSGVGKGNFSAAMAAAAIANLTLTPLQATNAARYLTANSTSPFITAYNRTTMVNVTTFNGMASFTETVHVSTLLSMKPEGRKLPIMHAFAEHSIPAESLACWHWRDNKADPAGHGDDIASSAFYIQANDIVDYYTSFEALPINATIYDFYGQACKGYATQPPVQVRLGGLRTEADGTLVNLEIQENMNKSGLTIAGRTVVMSENGLAVFQNTRLRAPEGPRVLELNATVTKPVRELASVRLLVYVRPCTIGEFLDPTTKDMCIGCPIGTYNMMPAATQCETCPGSTNCTAPNEGSMMLPDDGYWQSNLYSEQVLACPNPDSCTYDAREDSLREIQAVTWWAVKWMQGNASQRASMNTLADQKWKELLARRVMLGANVDVVKPVETMSDEEFVNAVYNLTSVYNQNYTTTLCAEGYMGTLCGACQPGWGLVDEASCIKCPAKSLNDLYYALATIFTIFTIGMTVLSSLEAQKTARDIRDHGMDVTEVQQHTERLHQLDPAGQGWHGQTSLNPVRDSVGPVDGSRPSSRAASVTAGPSSGTQLPPAAEGPNGSKSPLRPGPVAEATETDGGAPAPASPPASLPPAAHQVGGSATNGSGALNVGAVALLFDGQQADAHKPKPDIASAGSASSFRPDKSGYSATAGASGTQRQGSVQGGVNASGRLPSTKEAYSKYQGLTEYEIDELKRAEEEMREEALNRYAANQSTIMRIFISYIQVLALLRNVPIRYPDAYNNYLKLNNQATAYPGDIVTMDCSLPYFAAGGLPRSMLKIILSCASPLYILLGFAILTLFGDMAIYYKKRKSRAKLMKATKKRGKSGKGVPLGESVEGPEPYAAAITATTSNNNNGFTAVNTFARTKTSGSATAAGGASSLPVANSFAPVGAQPVYGFNSGALFFGLVKDNYCPTGRDDPLRNYGAFLWDRYFSQVLVMMIVIFFVLYPDVVDNLLSIFSCADVDFDKDGNPLAVKMGLYNKQVWTVDYNVTCYEGQHFVLAMALGIPGIILFAAGWPSINAVLMSPLGRQLCGHKTRFTEDMTEYYLNDYKPNFIWWESLVMLRKLAIALATTFLGSRDTDTGLNLLICMSILVVAVSLQLWFRPYHHVETNALEAGSICVLLLTLYLSLYFLLDASVVSNSGAIAVSAVIIGVNVAMVAIFLYYVMRSHWHTYIKDMGFDAEVLHGMSRAQIHQHMSKAMDEALPSFVPESVKSVITRAATGTLAHTVALQKRFSSPASLTVGTSATTMGTHISGPLSPKSPSGANGSGSPKVGTVNSLGRPQQQGQPERVNTLGRGKEEAKPKPSINPIDRLKSNK